MSCDEIEGGDGMMLYHGSNCEVAHPDLCHSRPTLDFGRGFYTTTIYSQAVNWCRRFKRVGELGIVSRYQFDDPCNTLRTLTFDHYSEAWIDFVLKCRKGLDDTDFDIVQGGIANDKVFNTVELYFDGLIDKAEALKRLRFEQPNWQVCFRSQLALSRLHFIGSEIV